MSRAASWTAVRQGLRVRPQITQGIMVSEDLGFPLHGTGPLEQRRDPVLPPEQDPSASFGGQSLTQGDHLESHCSIPGKNIVVFLHPVLK